MRIDADTGDKIVLESGDSPTPEELAGRDSLEAPGTYVPCEYGCQDICGHIKAAADILAGWCPNGSWSGGICRPANNNRSNWMGRYGGARVLPIGELVLLGTHNSA